MAKIAVCTLADQLIRIQEWGSAQLPSGAHKFHFYWWADGVAPSYDPITQTRTELAPTVDGDTMSPAYAVADRLDLAQVKSEAGKKIKADCEAKRAGKLTPGDGKMLEYREKAAEVERWAAGALEHTEANFPLIAATMRGRGLPDLSAAFALIAATLAAWRGIGAAVCEAEDKATTSTSAATDAAGVRAALLDLSYDLSLIQ